MARHARTRGHRLHRRSAPGGWFLCRGAALLAGPARWRLAAQLQRRATQDPWAERAGPGFPHRRAAAAWCIRLDQPVRDRIAGPDLRVGYWRACGRATGRHAEMKGWALLVMLAAAGAALSQTLPQVTVSATRSEATPFEVPASVDVIDGARLRAAGRPEINLSESVGLVPGVIARDRQNYAQDLQLSIRGFGARSTFGVRGVRVYVDGIPATMPDGQGQLSHIDLASAGRVELLRGPFSVLYGNSSGGVLQVFTEAGEGPPVVSPDVARGSDGLRREGLRVSGSTAGLGYVLSGNRFATDGWREHSGASRDLGNVRLDFKGGEAGDWTLVANSVDLRADDPLGLARAQFEAAPRSVDPTAIQFNTRKTVRQSQLGLVHEHRLGAGNTLRLMAYAG